MNKGAYIFNKKRHSLTLTKTRELNIKNEIINNDSKQLPVKTQRRRVLNKKVQLRNNTRT